MRQASLRMNLIPVPARFTFCSNGKFLETGNVLHQCCATPGCSNDEFDTFLSIPQEKFGFSNDAKVFLGPPSFDESSFYLKKNERLKIEISLR